MFMIQIIEKQSNGWHITFNNVDLIFIPPQLFLHNSFIPLKANADNGLRWRVNRKWISYNQIKSEIKKQFFKTKNICH